MKNSFAPWIAFLGAVVIAMVIHQLPSPLDPVIWTTPNALPKLIGGSAVNTLLQESVIHTYDFAGPECFAASSLDGVVYAGLNDGTVAAINQDGKYLDRVMFVGGYLLQKGEGNGLEEKSRPLFEKCKALALAGELAWNTVQEQECGRPLGIRYVANGGKGILYVLDAYWGLFRIDFDYRNSIEHVIGPHHHISRQASDVQLSVPHLYDAPKFYNDLDVLSTGDIVFTDSSYKFTRSENRQEVLDGAGRGRLFYYNATDSSLSVLLCGLHFPNGVQLLQSSKDRSEVIFAELTRFRIIHVNIHSVRKHASYLLQNCDENGAYEQALSAGSMGVRIFTDSVPGIADNIREDAYLINKPDKKDDKSYYLIGMGGKSSHPFSLLWVALQFSWVRVLVGKLFPMRVIEHLIPRYGLVLVVDEQGSIVNSLHDPTGEHVALVSVAFRHPATGDLWLGSHSEKYIAVVSHEKMPDSWA